MAQLKNTLIQGDARVTDTLYADIIDANELSVDGITTQLITINEPVANSVDATGGITLGSPTVSNVAHLGVDTTNFDIQAVGSIALRPNSSISGTAWSYNTGVKITSTELTPSGTITLGTSSNRWSTLYGTAADFSGTVNGLTLAAATTGFTIAGGTTSKTLTVADTVTINAPTQWGIVYGGASGTYASTAAGTSGQYLKSNGSAAPTWATFSSATVGLDNVENIALSTWAGTSNITTVGILSSGTVPWSLLSSIPNASTNAAGIIQIGTDATNAAAGNHTHGNITNTGCITTAITVADSDYLIIGDNSASGKLGKGPAFVSTTANKFLKDTGAFTAIAAADLPAATTSAKGAVIVGTGLNISSDTLNVSYGTSAGTALGTASAGTADTTARSDHVHPLPNLTSCTGTLTIEKGGTNATDAATARNNLGLGTMATQDADDYLPLTGGKMSGTIQLPTGANISAVTALDWISGSTSYAKVTASTSGAAAFWSKRWLCFFPSGDLNASTAATSYTSSGYYLTANCFVPTSNNTSALGDSTLLWSTVYGTTYNVNNHVTLQYNSNDSSLEFIFS